MSSNYTSTTIALSFCQVQNLSKIFKEILTIYNLHFSSEKLAWMMKLILLLNEILWVIFSILYKKKA